MSKNYEDLTGVEKVALFIMVLKAETSAKIFQSMNEQEIEAVSKAIAGLGIVSNEVIEKVLTEMLSVFEKSTGLVGNLSTTKELLSKALDEEKVNSIIENITGNIWDKFKKLESGALIDYLKEESPEVIAVVISKINNMDLISELMGILNEKKAIDVVLNLLSLGSIKSEVLSNLEDALTKQFSSDSNKQSAFVVEIFNNIDMGLEKKLSEQLKNVNPGVASYIKEKLFKFSDIVKVNDVGVQLLIKEIEKDDLKIALRYAEDEIKSLLRANLSERVFRIIQSELEGAEEVSENAIKKSMNKVASIARKLMIEKKISLRAPVKNA